MSDQAQHRYSELILLLQQHDYNYYVLAKPTVSDADYDLLMQELKAIEAEHPTWCRPESPSRRVGSDLTKGFEQAQHVTPMLSLDNIFNMADLQKRLEKLKIELDEQEARFFVCEPKVDGVSLDLCYTDGLLVRALTRGNGHVGDDVTANARAIRSIPLKLNFSQPPHVIHIRGEVYMTWSDFEEVNKGRAERRLDPLANPRNGAAGALKLLDPAECAARRLSFMPYHIAMCATGFSAPITQANLWPWLHGAGFNSFKLHTEALATDDTEELMDWVTRFEVAKKQLPYPTDGAVIKVNHIPSRRIFGEGEKSVKWGYAYKYAPDTAETRLNAITIQIGRTGKLTPVAELEPVEIAGTVVRRASLHNQDQITKLQLAIGDTVKVQKAGEIIPQVVGIVPGIQNADRLVYRMPDRCPVCNSPVINAEIDEEGPGVALVCTNTKGCAGQLLARLIYWCKKASMEIEDLGEVMLGKLFASGVTHPWQLYCLTPQNLFNIGFGEGQTRNAIAAIKASKDRGLERVLIGLGIPRIGHTISRKLARAFQNFKAIQDAKPEDLKKIVGLGDVDIEALTTWLADHENIKLVTWLWKVGVRLDSTTYNPEVATGAFAGKTVVFTGELDSMERPVAQRAVEAQGGRCTGSVSKKTSYLVVGKEAGNKKPADAAKHGVQLLNEEQFLKMLKNE